MVLFKGYNLKERIILLATRSQQYPGLVSGRAKLRVVPIGFKRKSKRRNVDAGDGGRRQVVLCTGSTEERR